MTSTPLADLAAQLAAGSLGASEAAQAAAQRISAAEGLNAFIGTAQARTEKDAARAQQMLDGKQGGSLCGMPIAVKDIFCTVGTRTTCGSKLLAEYASPYESHATELLADAGAVLAGKTNLDEFAMGTTGENSAFGPTLNPWDLSRSPGGSSSGSAAAVAARLVPVALGTDTGGSVRMPAAYCGIAGIKPTYGLVSRRGMVAYGSSLDQAGVFAAAATDLRPVLSAIAAHDPMDSTSLPQAALAAQQKRSDLKGLTVGIAPELFAAGVSTDVADLVRAAAEQLQQLGAQAAEVSLPAIEHAIPAYYILACAEASSNLSRFDGVRYGHRAEGASVAEVMMRTRSQGFGREVQRRILLGTFVLCHGYYDAYYRRAQQVRKMLIDDFENAFASCDLIAAPAAPTVAPLLGEFADDPVRMYSQDVCTVPANLAGLPAVAVPCGFAGGLPVGLQLIGPRMADGLLLDAAAAYQDATAFHREIPPAAAAG